METQTKTAHTPGPWIIHEGSQTGNVWIESASEESVVSPSYAFGVDALKNPTAMANARLIAAAPSMLEALKQAAFAIPTTHGAFDSVNRAIKVAIGQ